jgi:hypothetical protein
VGEAEYSDLILCIAVIEEQLQRWLDRGEHGTLPGFPARFPDPVLRLRLILSACSDEPLPQNPSLLAFITDQDLRDSILRDVRAADDALSNSEWKAATVLAGAAIEALLHWSLEQVPKPSRDGAVKSAVSSGLLTRKPPGNFDSWGLHHFIEVAGELKVLDVNTLTTVRQAKDYRNLIHPGRAVRLKQTCNRSTALVAVAALEQVVADLP